MTNVWTRSIAAAALVFAAASGAAAQDRADWPSRITMGTGPTGGTGYTLSSPWASIVGAAAGIPISVEATAGFPINTRMIDAGQAEIGMATTNLAYDAWNGAEFTNGEKLQNIRTLVVLDANVLQIFSKAGSGIASLADLNGKRISASRAKSEADTLTRGIAEALGIEFASVTNVSPTQANDLLRDGQIDAVSGTGTVPHPAITEYEAGAEVTMIGFTDAELQTYLAKSPSLARYVIPAGTFKGQAADVVSVGGYLVILASKDLPDSLAYELVKQTFASKEQLAAAYKNYGNADPANVQFATVPVHPGAIRFYEESGVQVPEKLKP